MATSRYSKIFKEAEVIKSATELASKVDEIIRKHFPNSYIKVGFTNKFGAGIDIDFMVGKDKSNWVNGISHNDISRTHAFIYGISEDGVVGDMLEFEPGGSGGNILANPPEGSHLAFGRIKVGLRKKKGTPEQILKHIDSYFSKLKSTIKSNKKNIPEDHMELLKGII